MIRKLTNDHDRLRSIIDRLDLYLQTDVPDESSDFARLRWRLIRELSVHVALERHALPTLCAQRDADSQRLDHDLDAVFNRHIIEWPLHDIQGAWRDYRMVAGALLGRLRQRLAYEETTLFRALG